MRKCAFVRHQGNDSTILLSVKKSAVVSEKARLELMFTGMVVAYICRQGSMRKQQAEKRHPTSKSGFQSLLRGPKELELGLFRVQVIGRIQGKYFDTIPSFKKLQYL